LAAGHAAPLEIGTPLSRRLVMLWTTDEEIASHRRVGELKTRRRPERRGAGARSPRCQAARLKTSRKGCGAYHLVVNGARPTPASKPEKGPRRA